MSKNSEVGVRAFCPKHGRVEPEVVGKRRRCPECRVFLAKTGGETRARQERAGEGPRLESVVLQVGSVADTNEVTERLGIHAELNALEATLDAARPSSRMVVDFQKARETVRYSLEVFPRESTPTLTLLLTSARAHVRNVQGVPDTYRSLAAWKLERRDVQREVVTLREHANRLAEEVKNLTNQKTLTAQLHREQDAHETTRAKLAQTEDQLNKLKQEKTELESANSDLSKWLRGAQTAAIQANAQRDQSWSAVSQSEAKRDRTEAVAHNVYTASQQLLRLYVENIGLLIRRNGQPLEINRPEDMQLVTPAVRPLTVALADALIDEKVKLLPDLLHWSIGEIIRRGS